MDWEMLIGLERPRWLTRDVAIAAGMVIALFLAGSWFLPNRALAETWRYRTLVFPFLVGAFCQAKLIEEYDPEAEASLETGLAVVLSMAPGILSYLLIHDFRNQTPLPGTVLVSAWLAGCFGLQQFLYLKLRRHQARSFLDRGLGLAVAVMAYLLAYRVAEQVTGFLDHFIFYQK